MSSTLNGDNPTAVAVNGKAVLKKRVRVPASKRPARKTTAARARPKPPLTRAAARKGGLSARVSGAAAQTTVPRARPARAGAAEAEAPIAVSSDARRPARRIDYQPLMAQLVQSFPNACTFDEGTRWLDYAGAMLRAVNGWPGTVRTRQQALRPA